MGLEHVAAALLSALLHAGWNAAVKASPRPTEAMTAQMLLSAIIVLPGVAWLGLPAQASWAWLAASTLMNTVTVSALLRAYELGGFGIVYPVARALSVLLVVPLSAWLAGDRIGPSGMAGIALITASLGLLAASAGRDESFSRAAMLWTLLAGLSTAAYVMCDAQGARSSGSPWAYGCAVSISNAAAMCWRQRKAITPLRLITSHWTIGLPTSVAAVVSYLLILWVWSQAPIAPASALRDTSAVFAILIAIVWLKEPFTKGRIAAVLLAAAAIPLLRLT